MPFDFTDVTSDEDWNDEEQSGYRCSDPYCLECNPQPEDSISEITFNSDTSDILNSIQRLGQSAWNANNTRTFSTDSATSVPFVGTTEEEIQEVEGEEVPQNTNSDPENGPIRPAPFPEALAGMRGIYFHDSGGVRIRANGTINTGATVQIAFWEMSPENVRAAFTSLKAWLVENQLGLVSGGNEYFTEGDFNANIGYYYSLCETSHRGYTDPIEILSQPDCSCGTEITYPSVKCPDCESNLFCSNCRAFKSDVRYNEIWGTHCGDCSTTCDQCEEMLAPNQERCPACHPSRRCASCPTTIYINDEDSIYHEYINENGDTEIYCDNCFNGLCHNCGDVVAHENIMEDEGHQCISCVSRNNHEEWDETSELPNESLAIPTIPGRETIRLVGVEIEGANGDGMVDLQGGQLLAESLYTQGISRNHSIGGYHSGSRGLVHVERDSSVDWELVIGPINVANPEHVDILNKSVRVVRGFINNKTLKLDMRAGLHVHVGADRVPFHNAYNLHKLYMYMEDFLYRFGAAKWPYHRSINRRGRDQAGKSPNTDGKLNFARTFSGQRYYGLSFDNYFARYFEQCECGARTYGLFDECTCDLGKCTFEFRLFNTTANTVKLHAYLAMCQALVAKAIEMEEIKDLKQYPALDFVKSKASDLSATARRKLNREWEKRIVFVNEQLPLTQEEKKSIHYCIINSEMGKTVTNADILLETEDN
jgi:hypothetical protein